jgi:hypothetical protein
VDVYVDGYNLYSGAGNLGACGTPGWRWLDIRALSRVDRWPDRQPNDEVGKHRWQRPSAVDLRSSQLTNPVGAFARPAGW